MGLRTLRPDGTPWVENQKAPRHDTYQQDTARHEAANGGKVQIDDHDFYVKARRFTDTPSTC